MAKRVTIYEYETGKPLLVPQLDAQQALAQRSPAGEPYVVDAPGLCRNAAKAAEKPEAENKQPPKKK